MKRCKSCDVIKESTEFYKHQTTKDRLQTCCKNCSKISLSYYKPNLDVKRAREKQYRELNKEKETQRKRSWKLKNRAIARANKARYRANKLSATPKWNNNFFIKEIYQLAQDRGRLTGVEWHVDHIVPLKNNKVCGLHTEINLQVITATENLKKSNTF